MNREERPPGLPPGAEPIEIGGPLALEQELNESRQLVATVPFTRYELSQVVNALAILESAMFETGAPGVALEARGLQMRLRRDIPFGPRVRAQMDLNREFLKLTKL